MAYSERLPTRLNPLAERTCFPQAPLSTFRVVSQSRAGLPKEFNRATSTGQLERTSSVTPLSCVFRAGRQGAVTDHVSILYDVDMETGVIGKGTTNEHWYQLGLHKILTTPWSNNCSTTVHPDTGRTITGTAMGEARMTQMMDLARAGLDEGLLSYSLSNSRLYGKSIYKNKIQERMTDCPCLYIERARQDVPERAARRLGRCCPGPPGRLSALSVFLC